MKSLITIFFCYGVLTYSFGQNITLSFENAQIIDDVGVDNDFYQVDVFIQSDIDFILGPGQFFIDYNEGAFGMEVSTNGNLFFEQPDGSILASTSFSVGNYNNFNTNDSGPTRASFNWLQFWSSGTIAANNVEMTSTFLGRIRIRLIDGGDAPDICFNTEDPRDDQFFTACGPFTPAPAGADCAGEIGTQLFDYNPDCSGAALPPCSGSVTTFTGSDWDNGAPDTTSIAIIDANYNTATMGLGSITACQLTVNAGASLTVEADQFLSITNDIIVNGSLFAAHNGNIIQIAEDAITTNNGVIQIQKTTPSLEPRDFIILSSPMSNEDRDGVYTIADRIFEILPAEFTPDPNPDIVGLNFLDDDGNYFSPATNLNVGQGYLVFPQAVTATDPINYTHTYTQGTLNSGIINVPVVYNGPATENNFNVLGNPYASSIDTDQLIMNNTAINEVYFWEHITLPDPDLPGFNTANFSMDDISIRNLTGGVAAVNGGERPEQFMASGQGFGILAQQSAAGSNLTFSNSLRVINTATLRSPDQDNRLWIRIMSENYALSSTALIGFNSQATAAFDPGYDSPSLATSLNLFTTLDDGQQLAIQGREAFNITMEIPLGFETRIPELETYAIGIDQLEGFVLEQHDIFLIDHQLNTITNLKETAYSFTTTEALQANRFTIVFEDRLLDLSDPDNYRDDLNLFPNPTDQQFTLGYSGTAQLKTMCMTDMNGRRIREWTLNDFSDSQTFNISGLASGIYLVNIQTTTTIVVKKLVIR